MPSALTMSCIEVRPPPHQTSSHFLVQELSLSPWVGYQHPRAQDGQLTCDCLPLSYSGCGVPSLQNPWNSSPAAVGPGDALLPLPSGWSTVSESCIPGALLLSPKIRVMTAHAQGTAGSQMRHTLSCFGKGCVWPGVKAGVRFSP